MTKSLVETSYIGLNVAQVRNGTAAGVYWPIEHIQCRYSPDTAKELKAITA
jgi:hypothetical protein